MATGIHNHGKEYLQRCGYNDLSAVSSIDIGLYSDTDDTLAETDDLGSITTEPVGASYSRQSATVPSDVTFSVDPNDDLVVEVDTQTWDTSDSTSSIDSYFVVINFQATVVTSDESATDHLFFTGSLGETINLSNWESFEAHNLKGILERP